MGSGMILARDIICMRNIRSESPRNSRAQVGTTRALIGLRLKARYKLGPGGSQPMRNLKPKLKTKPEQCPSSMSARVTDAGTRTRAGPSRPWA